MPFDNSPNMEDIVSLQREEKIALYMKRRRDAAEIWCKVPAERFDLTCWMVKTKSCGTVGCAIGWLVEKKVEGWHWYCELPSWGWHKDVYTSAAAYFGIDREQAQMCFSTYREGSWAAADVSRDLLALPVTVHTEGWGG